MRPRELTLDLADGVRAVLYLPQPLTAKQLAELQAALQRTMAQLHSDLGDPQNASDPAAPGEQEYLAWLQHLFAAKA